MTQLIPHGERVKMFKKHSQMKLQMKREALQELNRTVNESRTSTLLKAAVKSGIVRVGA